MLFCALFYFVEFFCEFLALLLQALLEFEFFLPQNLVLFHGFVDGLREVEFGLDELFDMVDFILVEGGVVSHLLKDLIRFECHNGGCQLVKDLLN